MTLRSASIALGRLERERGLIPAPDRAKLYLRAGEALDAADAKIAADNEPARCKLQAAERRYKRVRESLRDRGLT